MGPVKVRGTTLSLLSDLTADQFEKLNLTCSSVLVILILLLLYYSPQVR